MTITEVGEIVVRIDPEENWYAALAQAAAEAEKRGLGLRLVLPVAPQRCGDDVGRGEQDGGPR